MPITADGFDEDIEALKAEAETHVQKGAFSLLQGAMTGTPVNFGQHRNNWHADIASINLRFEGNPQGPRPSTRESLPPLDRESVAHLNAAATLLESWTLESGDIFIHNSGPAIEFLEDGSSAQAPQGILQPAIAAVRAKFGFG